MVAAKTKCICLQDSKRKVMIFCGTLTSKGQELSEVRALVPLILDVITYNETLERPDYLERNDQVNVYHLFSWPVCYKHVPKKQPLDSTSTHFFLWENCAMLEDCDFYGSIFFTWYEGHFSAKLETRMKRAN